MVKRRKETDDSDDNVFGHPVSSNPFDDEDEDDDGDDEDVDDDDDDDEDEDED